MTDDNGWMQGQELMVLAALGIQWKPGRRTHINCPFPDHEDKNPSWRWGTQDALWHCTCAHGDIFHAIMRMRGCDFPAAKRWAQQILAAPQSLPQHKPIVNHKPEKPKYPHIPIPNPPENADLEARDKIENHASLPDGWHSLGTPKEWWPYFDADRNIYEIRARYEGPKIREIYGKKKVVLPWYPTTGGKWVNRAAPAPRPLYNLLDLLARPDAPVLAVEGEPPADAAIRQFPEYAVTTTSGGSDCAHQSDFLPLKGRRVILWRDNDHPALDEQGNLKRNRAGVPIVPAGIHYQNEFLKHAAAAGAASLSAVAVPADWPDGWDLADEPPSDSIDLGEMIEDAIPWQPPQAEQAAPSSTAPLPDLPPPPREKEAPAKQSEGESFTLPIPTPFKWVDPATIPPRGFIYGTHFVKKYVSCTIAPTKTGKSSLIIAEAISIATGKPLLDLTPRETGPVWMWNGEDPRDDLQARVSACMLAHAIAPEEVEGRLYLDSGRDQPLVLTHQTRNGTLIAEPVEKHLVQYLCDLKIIAAIIDPFISSHRIPENDNTLMDMVAKTWARIADKANCAIDLVHHTRKNNGGEVNAEDARGASALLSSVRASRVLNRMTKEQAGEFGIQEGTHRRYFWVGGADSSLAAPTEESRWHQLVTVNLGNGDHEGIGAVKRWRPASLMDKVSSDDVRLVQQEIENGGPWRENSQCSNWAGHAVALALDIDLPPPEMEGGAAKKAKRKTSKEHTQISKMLRAWLKSGALRIVERTDDTSRRLKKFVEVGVRV